MAEQYEVNYDPIEVIRGADLNPDKPRNYNREVAKDALDALDENDGYVVEAIKEGQDFYEARAAGSDLNFLIWEYAAGSEVGTEEALFILDHCENEETGDGLWEGLNHDEALQRQALHSYANDVVEKAKEVYEEMQGRYEDLVGNLSNELEDLEDRLEGGESLIASEQARLGFLRDEAAVSEYAARCAFNRTLEDKRQDSRFPQWAEPLMPGSGEEASAILSWLVQNRAMGMRRGEPLGGAYIDARSTAEESVHVWCNETQRALSQALGFYTDDGRKEQGLELRENLALWKGVLKAADEPASKAYASRQIAAAEIGLAELKEASAQAAQPERFKELVNKLHKQHAEGKPLDAGEFQEMIALRDFRGAYTDVGEKYLALVHPDVATAYHLLSRPAQDIAAAFVQVRRDPAVGGLAEKVFAKAFSYANPVIQPPKLTPPAAKPRAPRPR